MQHSRAPAFAEKMQKEPPHLTQVQRLFYIDSRFRAFREQFRQLSTALRRRSPGSLLLLVDGLHRGEQQNIADGGAVGEQHDQAIHTEA